MELTSVSLLDRLRAEPREADWSRFVALYGPFIKKFIRLDPTLAADADDIAQEVMTKLVTYLPSFQRARDGSFRCWLRTITINEVNDYWRRRRRNVGGIGHDAVLAGLVDPANALTCRWDAEYTDHVLGQMQAQIAPEFSATTWEAFRQRVLEERSTAEVAACLGLSRNAVDIAKSRVLSRLRQEAAGLIDE